MAGLLIKALLFSIPKIASQNGHGQNSRHTKRTFYTSKGTFYREKGTFRTPKRNILYVKVDIQNTLKKS
jgi:hypothetical protein